MQHPNYIAGYIVDPNAKNEPLYLLLKRSMNCYLPGIWQIVTGKLNLNESASQAVVREILEETGLTCSEIYNVDVTMFYDQFKSSIAFSANFCAFVDHQNTIKLSENEHDQYMWCTLKKALDLLAFASQKETLIYINKHYVLQKPHPVNRLKIDSLK